MAIRNIVTRGYGAGASIAFVVTRGYSIGEDVNPAKSVIFQSASAFVLFSALDFLSRILQEDGFVLLKEDGGALLKEQESSSSSASVKTISFQSSSALVVFSSQ